MKTKTLEDKRVRALIEGITMMYVGYLNSLGKPHTEEQHKSMSDLCNFLMEVARDLLQLDKEEVDGFIECVMEKSKATKIIRH